MSSLDDLTPVLRAPAGERAEGAIVLLHGPGANEHDLAGLMDILDPQKRLGGAFPRGTMDMPNGFGHRWFVDREMPYPQRDTFEQTLEIMGTWLDMLNRASGVPPERTLIGGFSQGAVMAWALALSPNRPRYGGLLAMSGYIPRVTDFEPDDSRLKDMPVAILHGENDPTVAVNFARTARDRAENAGARLLYRETDVPHIVDPRNLPDLINWVQNDVFPAAEAEPEAEAPAA